MLMLEVRDCAICNMELWFEANVYPFHIQQHIVKLSHLWHKGQVDSICI